MVNARDLPAEFVMWDPTPVMEEYDRLKFVPTKKGEENAYLKRVSRKALKKVRDAMVHGGMEMEMSD